MDLITQIPTIVVELRIKMNKIEICWCINVEIKGRYGPE